MALLCGMPTMYMYNTVFRWKRSAYGGTQRPPKSQNTNGFLR